MNIQSQCQLSGLVSLAITKEDKKIATQEDGLAYNMEIPKPVKEQTLLSVLFRFRARRLRSRSWFRPSWYRHLWVNCRVVKPQVWVSVVHGEMLDPLWRKYLVQICLQLLWLHPASFWISDKQPQEVSSTVRRSRCRAHIVIIIGISRMQDA